MQIEFISFEQGEEGAVPDEVSVTMSIMEAAQIAQVFGQFSDLEFTKRGWPVTHMYADLCSNVFNRYWDDGVDAVLPKGRVK
jgi:hypothetical protein